MHVSWYLILLRLLHIGLGALWVGMMAFTVVFLQPALRDAGPSGQAVMAGIQRRRFMTVMPIIALITILSGMLLMHRLYADMSALMTTPGGLALVVGALAAIVAFILGVAVVRPAMTKAGALAQSMASAGSEAERAKLGAHLQRLQARGAAMTPIVFGLLLVALGAMAVARYL